MQVPAVRARALQQEDESNTPCQTHRISILRSNDLIVRVISAVQNINSNRKEMVMKSYSAKH